MDILYQPLLRALEMINSGTHEKCLAQGRTKVSTQLTLKEQEIRTDIFIPQAFDEKVKLLLQEKRN